MRLGVIVTYRAGEQPDGTVLASNKFLAEMDAYAARWPGPVDVYVGTTPSDNEVLKLSPIPEPTANLTYRTLDESQFGFDAIDPLPDVLMSAIDAPLDTIPRRCQDLPVKTVVAVENTFKTRLQHAFAERSDLRSRVGGLKWNLGQQSRIRRAVHHADGFQANGYPAFNAYKRFAKSAIVYLDSRASEADMPSREDVRSRANGAGGDGPLRIAFTGRLEAHKGVLEVTKVALALRDRGVDFSFLVAGDGSLKAELESDVVASGLADHFEIPGVLDFDAELMPRLRQTVDVFFCPHPQGDPSCTYVETMAAGVPIVGYANEAVRSLSEHTAAVQAVDMGDARAAADVIAGFRSGARDLVKLSEAALNFARTHSFEREYDARVEHFLELAHNR